MAVVTKLSDPVSGRRSVPMPVKVEARDGIAAKDAASCVKEVASSGIEVTRPASSGIEVTDPVSAVGDAASMVGDAASGGHDVGAMPVGLVDLGTALPPVGSSGSARRLGATSVVWSR
jgi:hypothetical protein